MVRPEDGDQNWYEYTHTLNKNVSHLIDKTGSIVAHYDYDAYGNMIEQTGPLADVNPIRFSSEYHDDDLGLVYYNYRHYNPKDGRWINRDPISESGGINLYVFLENKFNLLTDSLGKRIYYFGGKDEEKTYTRDGKMLNLENGRRNTGANKVFPWHKGEKGLKEIKQYAQKNPKEPIIITGFSYGGDTAYGVAKELKKQLPGTSVYLFTFDPVSQLNPDTFFGESNPGVDGWINAAREGDTLDVLNSIPGLNLVTGFFSLLAAAIYKYILGDDDTSGNLVSSAGGSWNHCNNADQNTLSSTIPHGDLKQFLDLPIPMQDGNTMKVRDLIKELNEKKR